MLEILPSYERIMDGAHSDHNSQLYAPLSCRYVWAIGAQLVSTLTTYFHAETIMEATPHMQWLGCSPPTFHHPPPPLHLSGPHSICTVLLVVGEWYGMERLNFSLLLYELSHKWIDSFTYILIDDMSAE